MNLWFVVCLSVAISISDCNQFYSADDYVNEWVVQLRNGVSEMKAISRQLGLQFVRRIEGLDGYYVVRRNRRGHGLSVLTSKRLKRNFQVVWQEQQRKLIRRKRVVFNDKLYSKQWYLRGGGSGGFDMNVQKAWDMGFTGKGVVVSVLDDGIAKSHPELKENYDPQASYDLNDDDSDPSPRFDYRRTNKHGTECAAEVAGVANNSLCGVGVAYRASIGGIRLLDGEVTDSIEASALAFRRNHIDIYSSAWGPEDNGKAIEGPGPLASTALRVGVERGRDGLGSIFMWASGNGGNTKDTCACDGYVGSIYTLSVSSVTESNQRPWYLEPCASTLVTTYSSGTTLERSVITASIKNRCIVTHSGTSASVSLAAGIVALTLEANRNLTWRDVQYITLLAANPEPFVDGDWITNAAGRKVSLLYGYGLMDAAKMVYLAPLWRRTPDQRTCKINIKFDGKRKTITKHRFVIQANDCLNSTSGGVRTLEHVQLFLQVILSRRGSLKVTLISPSGTPSVMLLPRLRDYSHEIAPFDDWPLTSVHFWGEPAFGDWKLIVESVDMRERLGSFEWGELVLYGVSEEQPIRLRPPMNNSVPPVWFERNFRSLVMVDEDLRDNGPLVEGNETQIECHDECANGTACTGEDANQCEACRNFRVASDGFCVQKCPGGTFPVEAQRVCEACHLQCASCNGPSNRNCTECRRGSALLPDQHRCLGLGEHCPQGSFLSGDGKECRACSSPCETCASKDRCLRCRSDNGTWVLSPTNQCVRACPARHYVSTDRRCLPCPSTCSACISGRDDGCTSCPVHRLLLKTNRSDEEGYCVDRCPTGFYLDKRDNMCLRCHETCGSCRGPSDKECVLCREPLVHYGGVCIDPADLKCKNGHYKKLEQCLPCHPSCERCDGGSAGNCLECRQVTDVYYNGHCQARCPDGLFPHNMTDKYSVHGVTNICVFCHSLCAACRGPTRTHCTRCHPSLLLTVDGSCHSPCATGLFGVTTSSGKINCEACSDTACAVCTFDKRCLKCRQGHVLYDGRCQIGGLCPKGHGSLHGRCVPCPDPGCEKCSGDELRQCKNCRSNYHLHPTGKCLPPRLCRANEYPDKLSICRPCHHLCRTCSGPSDQDCTSCPINACPILGVCRPCCSSSSAGQAIASPFPCANCSLGPNPSCLLPNEAKGIDTQGAPGNQVNKGNVGFFGDLPSPMRLLIVLAFLMCALLPVIYFAIFCTLQLRSGEPIFCCLRLRRHTNPRPAGPDYTPLSQNANGSPEKGSMCDDVDGQLEMTECRLGRNIDDVMIQRANGFIKDSDESSGVGSSPDKSPDRNDIFSA